MLFSGCMQSMDDGNESWDIGSTEYVDIMEQGMMHMQNMEFDAWGELLADDVEHYFPNRGD